MGEGVRCNAPPADSRVRAAASSVEEDAEDEVSHGGGERNCLFWACRWMQRDEEAGQRNKGCLLRKEVHKESVRMASDSQGTPGTPTGHVNHMAWALRSGPLHHLLASVSGHGHDHSWSSVPSPHHHGGAIRGGGDEMQQLLPSMSTLVHASLDDGHKNPTLSSPSSHITMPHRRSLAAQQRGSCRQGLL